MTGTTINDTVAAYGTHLVEHKDRFGTVETLGLDEVLFAPIGPWHRPEFSTQIVDGDRRLAHRSRHQRSHRSSQQLDQAGQAGRLRLHVVPQLPDPVTALRREARLGSARHDQTPLKSEVPVFYGSGLLRERSYVDEGIELGVTPSRLGSGVSPHAHQVACADRRFCPR